MSYSSSRTTRTVQYGGPGGSRTVETRTTTSDGGTRTETVTHGGGGSGGDIGFNIGTKFGGINISGGTDGRFKASVSNPVQGRYSKGWGSSRPPSRPPPGPPMQLEGKTFVEIRDQCLREGRLFEDPDFPAVDKSIFYSKSPPRPFEWKRPPELMSNPKLFVGGASRFDVKQGELGDCWLLAAVACLCGNKKLLYRVVPQDQDFTEDKKYAGIFRFMFWQYGKWTEVIVDDRLPSYNDRLVFMHSADASEFWTPLLEKAYAKLMGSYEALKGGATSEAMEDFTGGVTEIYDFRQNTPANLFTIMLKAHERGSLMGCSIEAMPGRMEAELSNGLIMGHAYSITDVKMIDIKTRRTTGQIPLVRVRNPWGNECEWKGSWSDKSREWQFIDDAERKEIGLTFDDDGEFWMSFQDFTSNFQKLEICNLGPDSEGDTSKKRWEGTQQDGGWKKRVNAGGCRNYLDTFWTNPQYRVHVIDPDEDDEENMGTIIVGLMQKERRAKRKEGLDMLTIGYCIYKLKEANCEPLDVNFFKYNASVAKSPSFINMREVCGRHKLPPGHYCVLPSTFEPQQEGDFLLRIFSEKPAGHEEIDEATEMADVQIEEEQNTNGQQPTKVVRFFNKIGEPFFKLGKPFKKLKLKGFGFHAPKFFVESQSEVEIECEGLVPVHEEPVTATRVPQHEVTDDDRRQEEHMRAIFKRVSGEDMEIDAYELQEILNAAFRKEFKFEGFSADTCRSLVAMMDVDRSGKLGFEEFKKLWGDLRIWKTVFKRHDADASGNFNSYEVRKAFHAIGFKVSNGTFNAIVQRYCHRDGKMYFDDFIHCVARMRTMFEIFREMKNGPKAEFQLDEFIQTTMYS